MRLISTFIICLALACNTQSQREKLNAAKDETLHRSKRFIGTEEIISVVATILELWDLIDTKLADNNISIGDVFSNLGNVSLDLSFVNRKQALLTESFLGITRQLDRMEASLAYSADYTIDSILTAMPKILRTELRLHDLKSVINQINLQDRELQRYLSNQSAIERHTLEDWALAVSSHHQDSIRNLMSRLHEDVSPTSTTVLPYSSSIFKLILQMVRDPQIDPVTLSMLFVPLSITTRDTRRINATDKEEKNKEKLIMKSALLMLLAACLLDLAKTEPGLSKMDELRYHAMAELNTLWEELTDTNDINNPYTITDIQLMNQYKSLTKNISEMEALLSRSKLEPLTWDWNFAHLVTFIDSMNAFFDAFKRLQDEPIRWRHELAWTDMAAYLLEKGENGVNKTIEKIHKFSMMSPGLTLFQKALEDSRSSICELQQSQQELIYHMYNMVSLAELKGYTMLQFAWMLLKIYEKGNFMREAELMRKLYTERTTEKVNAAREAMASADRSLYRCDPKEWKEGENYVKLTKLLQGYIENEVNLNPEGTCGQNCKYYDVTEYHGCFKNQFCANQRPCHGQVMHCTYYDSDMNICKSESSDRRYDWIEYENRKILGRKGTCPNRSLFKVDSWWRYLFWHCSYCFCLCDDNHPSSDRYFNLREVTSDVEKNKVITGVRLVKNNQVIHIQIQEGVLGERGLVNKSTIEWVPIRGYNINASDVRNEIDYHTMNHRQRGIDLDDVKAQPNHAVTGVKFRRIGNHLNLEVAATLFDFATGKLRPAIESKWIANDNTDATGTPRSEVVLPDPDIPTRHGPHLPSSKHDQYLLFRESSLLKDASQTTVPFIDSQPVESGGLLLAGLGLHYRGALDSGGFVALKAITYDYSPHMVPQTPNNVA